MTSVFIVRPFGKKSVTVLDKDGNDSSVLVDFNQIDKELIQAALKKNKLVGKTTEVIASAGNIRLDMFQMLIAYDLVIADISIDNANVFYELGIRHGLRPNGTILIRFPISGKDVPFDLKTDRYIAYERENPSAAVDLLASSIGDTILTMRSSERKADSPVFLLLPALAAPDPMKLTVVPREFQEAIDRAKHDGCNGAATLALLAEEAKATDWARGGLKLVGRAQRGLAQLGAAQQSRYQNGMNVFKLAKQTWEYIRRDVPYDVEANLQLATIYQRLNEPETSSQACERVLDGQALAEAMDRADALAQLARNKKADWVKDFISLESEADRRQQALLDSRLIDAYEGYRKAFAEDLNVYYPAINALGLLLVIVNLAEIEAEVWGDCFETPSKADNALADYREQLIVLDGAVQMALEKAKKIGQRTGKPDEWLPPSEAQYKLLTSKKPVFVGKAYQAAKNSGGKGFVKQAEIAQVKILQSLGLFTENCSVAIKALMDGEPASGLEPGPPQLQPRGRILVVTGHRIDSPDRQAPGRFPNTPECIEKARGWLLQTIQNEKNATEGAVSGMGGAASGTDILFHEVCAELDIPTTIVLPIPIESYRRKSVADGGAEWVEKFNKLVVANPPIILSDSEDLPIWTRTVQGYSVFQRGNIWMMEDAMISPNTDVTLLALWNGAAGDGPGGTADMVSLAEARGLKLCRQNTNQLFELD